MRIITIVLVAFSAMSSILNPINSYSAEWRQVETFIQGEKDYIDQQSVERKGPVVTFLTRNVDAKDEATEMRVSINCERGTGAIREIAIYGPDGTVSRSYSYPEGKLQWGRITPRSCMERFKKLLCEDRK